MNLADRMKDYEWNYRQFLVNRLPIIIRIDGNAFHTFTRGMQKPFDEILSGAMRLTMQSLCENISGAVFGYTQSDEISIVIYNPDPNSSVWFERNVNKIISLSASMATLYFNKFFEMLDTNKKYSNKYSSAIFDSRVFVLPNKDEVINYFIWRQGDSIKNSISSLARMLFSQKQINGLKGHQMKEKMLIEKEVDWNDVPNQYRNGSCCSKKLMEVDTPNGRVERNRWIIDLEMPEILNNKDYINFM